MNFEHLEKKQILTPEKHPWKNKMEEDTIRELPNEKRSFESNLAKLEEEDTYWTETKIAIDADAGLVEYEESVDEDTYAQTQSWHEANEIPEYEDDNIVEELREQGLTDE